MTEEADIPQVFALIRGADESRRVVGYGLVLPDGSAYSVSWPAGRGTSGYSASSAQETAALRGAEVLWMSDRPRWVTHGDEELGWAARLARGVLRVLGVGARASW